MEPILKPISRRVIAKNRTREKVIQAARELWAKPGSYPEGTMRGIAAHMGMSTGSIFANFSGKDALWRAAFGTEPPVDSEHTRQALEFYRKVKEGEK